MQITLTKKDLLPGIEEDILFRQPSWNDFSSAIVRACEFADLVIYDYSEDPYYYVLKDRDGLYNRDT